MATTQTQPFLRHAFVYGLGTMLLQAAGMLLLPLYTRFLTPAEYGALEVAIRIGEVVAVCLLFNGLRQALLVLHGQTENTEERHGLTGTSVAVIAGCVVCGAIFALVAPQFLGNALGIKDSRLLQLGVLTAVMDSACAVLLALAQARTQSVFFVVVSCIQLLARVALCLLLVAGLGWGARGVLVASLVTSGGCAVVLGTHELWRRPMRVNRAQAREMIRFALPLLLCGVGFSLLNYGDRFFLLRSAGSYEVGLYAFGYKVALAVGLFARGPLLMVWSSYMYPLARSADAAHVFGRAFTRMQAGYVFIGLGLCLFLDKAIALLGGSAYSQAAAIVPVIVLAYFFLGSADLMDGAFYLRRRTDLKTWVALASTVLMLALYALLIPLWGSSGAAWATVVGFAIHAALTRWVSQPLFAVHHEPGRIAAMLVLAASLWGLSLLLPASVWAMPAKLGLWALWPLGLWLGGLVRPEEKAWLRAAALQLLALFRAAFGSAPTNAPRLFQTATCREGEAPAEPLRRAAPVEGEAPAEPGSPVARQEPRPPIAAVEVIARQGDQGM